MKRGPQPPEFGSGRVINQVVAHAGYEDLTHDERVHRLGKVVGCPVVNELIRPESKRGGAAGMSERYLQVGIWFGHMVHATEEVNERLAMQLKMSVGRRPGELVGKHEPESVPESYGHIIPPTETLVGYALPRLLIKLHAHNPEDRPQESDADRLLRVWGTVEDAAARSGTPNELLVHCAENAVVQGMDTEAVLQTILPVGWYGEHNGDYMVDRARAALQLRQGTVWQAYDGMTAARREELGIL